MAKHADVPQFGSLSGIKVAFSAISVAGPFFGVLFADNGADVVWIENASGPSLDRSGDGNMLAQDRRNMRALALDIPSPAGRKVFLDLMKDIDIFLEASKGGQYAKWGLTDEVLWEANPKLVIVHLSGFGQYGDPSYVPRASYDPIAQAFGGMMFVNSKPGQPMTQVAPVLGDFLSGLLSYGSALGAYIKAQQTGIGESIDLSQYETILRCMGNMAQKDWNYPPGDRQRFQPGFPNNNTAGYNSYMCKDGNNVMMLIFNPAVMRKAFPIFGLEYGTEEFPAKFLYNDWDPEGIKLDEAINKYCMEHTAAEVEAALAPLGIPCICAMTFEQMMDHPHYQARETIVKLPKVNGEEIYVSNVHPKLKNNPGKAWRQPPSYGLDTKDILTDLGYTEEHIKELLEQKAVNCGE